MRKIVGLFEPNMIVQRKQEKVVLVEENYEYPV